MYFYKEIIQINNKVENISCLFWGYTYINIIIEEIRKNDLGIK